MASFTPSSLPPLLSHLFLPTAPSASSDTTSVPPSADQLNFSALASFTPSFPFQLYFISYDLHPFYSDSRLSAAKKARYSLEFLVHKLKFHGMQHVLEMMQVVYRHPTTFLCHWFSPATDDLMIRYFIRFIDSFLNSSFSSIKSWFDKTSVFVQHIIALVCNGSLFVKRLGDDASATQCRRIFRQCIKNMNVDRRIYCFWLFTHMDFSGTMVNALFKDISELLLGLGWEPRSDPVSRRSVNHERRERGSVRITPGGDPCIMQSL